MTERNEQPVGLRTPPAGDPDLERPYVDIQSGLSVDLDLVLAQRPSAERAFRSFARAKPDSPSRRGRALGSRDSDSSAEWDGYAFYHSQDAERLVETRPTYVAFGVFLRRCLPIDEIKAMSPTEGGAFVDEKVEALVSFVIVLTFEVHRIDVDYCVPLNEGGLKDGRTAGG